MKNLKINLSVLKKVESGSSEMEKDVISMMISNILHYDFTPYESAQDNIKLAINTLKGIGVLEDSETTAKNTVQLNS